MPLSLKQLEAEALDLPAEQRADLAQRLFDSVEDEAAANDPSETSLAWIEEADRRYQRYRAGETHPVPAADAIARVRDQLKNF
ncbi:MAG TPA: addiction module protein [Longimicrobium sp.]|nr:addiction module protein [Longimicrobium sp.]